jgi:3-hydroxyisobutyrate dehydrogenase-like beta-hydroxyacid dehydrogenase
MRIAILGLGRMGAAIAERLAITDHEVSVWNRSTAATEAFAARKIRVLAAPAEAFAHADLVITMLADGAALESVAIDQGLLAAAPAGLALMDMSTIGVESSERIAAAAEAAGVDYLRAPVSGNPSVVAAGNLAIIVSGPRERFDALGDVLAAIGPNLFYVGSGEQARVVKLAVNLMLGGTAQLLAEALVLGELHDIERSTLLEVIGSSAIGSPFIRYKTDALVADDYSSTFTTTLLAKDLRLALDAAAGARAPLPLTDATRELAEACIAAGMGGIDLTALLPRLRHEAGLA